MKFNLKLLAFFVLFLATSDCQARLDFQGVKRTVGNVCCKGKNWVMASNLNKGITAGSTLVLALVVFLIARRKKSPKPSGPGGVATAPGSGGATPGAPAVLVVPVPPHPPTPMPGVSLHVPVSTPHLYADVPAVPGVPGEVVNFFQGKLPLELRGKFKIEHDQEFWVCTVDGGFRLYLKIKDYQQKLFVERGVSLCGKVLEKGEPDSCSKFASEGQSFVWDEKLKLFRKENSFDRIYLRWVSPS